MLTRIVKMTFRAEETDRFKTMITQNAYLIKAVDGCEYLRILQAKQNPNEFFTYSYWRDEAALETYRKSDLFRRLWSRAKEGFAAKPEAWSVDNVIELTE